jgi:hypothetical protein
MPPAMLHLTKRDSNSHFHRMAIQDVHLLVAQARVEADNPAFKVCFTCLP